jgi:hypothetical protein
MLASDKLANAYKLPSVARAPRRELRRARILEKCTLTDPAYLDQTAGLRVNASVITGLRNERENQVIGFSRLD